MQQGDDSSRFTSNQSQNPQYALQADPHSNAHIVGTPGVIASQPPPYPGTQPLPSMTHTFSQRQSPYSDLHQSPLPYQTPGYQGQTSYAGMQGQGYGLQLAGNTNAASLSPGAVPMQGSMRALSPGAAALPRKSLAGMMSPIRPQAHPPSLNMPPPSSPVVMGGRMQGPLSPLSVYMSQAQSPQRRTSTGHMQNMQSRSYPPHSPVYHHTTIPYSYSPQQAQTGPRSSPVPSPMYVDPSQQGQMSPLMPSQQPTHIHSPQSVVPQVPVQLSQSPYKAARQLNMTGSPKKTQQLSSGGTNQQWQYGTRPGTHDMWENVNTASLVPLPVLSSDTLDLLSTLTVSTVSSPVQSSANVGVVESKGRKSSSLLQQHLLMPATPIQTPTTGDNLLAIAGSVRASITTLPKRDRVRGNVPETPPSRSNSKRSVRPTRKQTLEEKPLTLVDKQSSALACMSTSTLNSNIVTSVCTTTSVNPEGVKMSAPHSAQEHSTTVAMAGDLSSTTADTSVNVYDANLPPVAIAEETSNIDLNFIETSVSPETVKKREQLGGIYATKLDEKLNVYRECLTELFFLQNGGNFMDYVQFKKRPSTKLLEYLKSKMPDVKQGGKNSRKFSHDSLNSNMDPASPASDLSGSKKTVSDDARKERVRSVSQDGPSDMKPRKNSAPDKQKNRSRSRDESEVAECQPAQAMKVLSNTLQPNSSLYKSQSSPLRQSTPAQLDESIGSQEEILERAKQEAVIQRKVVELRKQGLWTQRRLPKVQEPPRNKTHWDYLLEEVRWLAADFAQERKWKRAAARKLARGAAAYHKDRLDQERRAKREEQNRLRRIASTMAREIRIFWSNIGKVVEYKQRSLLDEKRQKALDLHLSYIVDQTEKYSDWLTQGLNKPNSGSVGSASPSRSLAGSKQGSDDDFLPQGESSDDEETIAVAEQESAKDEEEDEISLLKRESELPFNELLESLPAEIIENIGKPVEENEEKKYMKEESIVVEKNDSADSCDEAETSKPSSISLRRSARKRRTDAQDENKEVKRPKMDKDGDDEEFDVKGEDSATDDEATIEQEERQESSDHKKEIENLQLEGEMPLEELMKLYGSAFDPNTGESENDDAVDENEGEDEVRKEDLKSERTSAKEESSSESEDELDEVEMEEEEIGMDYLLKVDLTKDDNAPMIIPADQTETLAEVGEKKEDGSPSKEITDVAAEAASLQPTGFTLATTQVVTPIPVLLKHTLREYQHIGLDWLVTMYDKRLNGILADEMGLGKTIQTIALLAHLACDKGVWGPHLIVVPTSVMLNWEMEFKKWCPGFKILTYYGSQKERKAKRTGWTKSNAFHVCITSYKLVLQDNASFRRKKWKYLVLDEAQNIKNFKSQRWQTLLNFNSQRRLLLTGTPLQNNLMELWSLMHFLMPHVFQSHKEFKEWFSNPLTGMIEGGQEYNEKLVRRLHKVLRPFLLRRIKKDVEKQMPNKYEHVVRCHLSKRQRFLYDDFMSQASTKDTLESGHFMSVINILMQLRKVCNHPNLFEPRPIVSPFYSEQIVYHAPSLATKAMERDPFKTLDLEDYHLHLPSLTNIRQTHAQLLKQLKTQRKLIEELPENSSKVEVEDKAEVPKVQGVKEQLAGLLKERDKLKAKTSQPSVHLLHSSQSMTSLPVLTIPISSTGSSLQFATSGATVVPPRVITLPSSKSEDHGRTSTSQSFTLQYQTPQGARVAIPNKQIRQLKGGVVQIMTPGTTAKVLPSSSQSIVSIPVAGQAGFAQRNEEESCGEKNESAGSGGKREVLEVNNPTTYVERLEQEFASEHKARCLRMANKNDKLCEVTPSWLPRDTIDFCYGAYRRPEELVANNGGDIEGLAILELVKSAERRLLEMEPITDRFAFVIPLVEAKPIDCHVSHPCPSKKLEEKLRTDTLQVALKHATDHLLKINLSMKIQFPEARLIQYDCGKLQVLDVLLRRFWGEKHKCLIFTQMTKVLDILEAFLSYHGYRYLRLDGSTRVEQRMLLMERFNNDSRIFCFILSTRSGGIGVNLTGADTVIFYDSDWNPTMDAQAQDRCHRIGQTRDVHIYRLISERTVEENILKKANQKRLLGDIAIEGGSFTTAFFKEQAIKDLFNEPTGLENMQATADKGSETMSQQSAPAVLSKPVTARQKAIAAAKEGDKSAAEQQDNSKVKPEASWEDALQQTEDKEDVDAAKQLREEQDADMEEFTENTEGEDLAEGSRVQEEMKSIYEELTAIERYALRYLEETTEEINREELELAEEQVHRSKQDWELAHLVALKEEEERRLEEEEDEIFYTREDAENQIFVDDVTGETMPIWFPPTPPQDDNDLYIDPISSLLYIPGPMPEDLLPAVHLKKERKRVRTDSPGLQSQPRKYPRSEFHAPKSLFNRPQTVKKASKPRKVPSPFPQVKIGLSTASASGVASAEKENTAATAVPRATEQAGSAVSAANVVEPAISATGSSKNPEWLIHEDLKLLQAVQQVLGMPLSLIVMMPAHTPNWDLVADIVNSISSVYRSPKMCKQRFESEIAPREEGRSSMESSLLKRKMKGTRTPTKLKVMKTQKTMSMHSVDNNLQYSSLFSSRFDAIGETCSKRTMPIKPSNSGQFQRNPKHTSILQDNGIAYDNPLPPDQVASMRASRIQREKEAKQQQQQQQQLAQSQTMHTIAGQQIAGAQVSKPGISSLAQLTAIPLSGSTTANIIVNSSALKKINQHTTSKTTLGTSALQQTLLRTASTGESSQQLSQPQIQIQQQGQAASMVSVGLLHRISSPVTSTSVTTIAASNNTITLSSLTRPSITMPAGAVIQGQGSPQLAKQFKQQRLTPQMQLQLQKQKKTVKSSLTPQKLQITPEAIKKLRQQQLEAGAVTVPKTSGKQRKPSSITPQELEQILKSQTIRRSPMQKAQPTQVQIAPVHAQVQAQQVQDAAAQQAAQHVTTSKPLPITVPVSNLVSVAAVNISGMSMSLSSAGTSGQGKSLVMTAPAVPANIQQQLQRQLIKHRMVSQQQGQTQLQTQQAQTGQVLASKLGVKQTVYAMVATAPPFAQGKRRTSGVSASVQGTSNQQGQSSSQQPVLTVTKLLHAQSMPGQTVQMKHPITQGDTLVQQVRQQSVGTPQQLQVGSATIIPSSSISQQRLITPQRQIRQIQQPTQMILTPASGQQFLQRQNNQNIVASLSISATASTAAASALSSPVSQNANLTQQLQSLLNPQVIRAQSQTSVGGGNQIAMRTVAQQHHLVLQQPLTISQQNPSSQMTSPVAQTTLTMAPQLVLPVPTTSSSGAPSQAQMTLVPSSDAPSTTGLQYVSKTLPQ